MKILKKKYLVGKIGELEIAGEKFLTFNYDKSERYWEGWEDLKDFDSLEEAENYILNNSKGFWENYTIITIYYTEDSKD